MTKNRTETDEDIASDVLPPSVSEKAVPVELDSLQPWHKPRKQFIRERQWLHRVKNLIDKISNTHWLAPQTNGPKEIKYLTLPGIDYFDVRVLAEYCKSQDISVTSTSYLSGAESNPYVARAKVRETALIEADYISIHSTTSNRRLEELSHGQGPAFAELEKRGPFHVVNIDACQSISPAKNDDAHRIIHAIYKIVEYQLSVCSGRWLLFLTTDARTNNLSKDTLLKFTKAVEKNASDSAEFREAVNSLFETLGKDFDKRLDKAKSKSSEDFVRFFSLGFSKWLLHLAEEKRWKLKMHTSFFYSTELPSKPVPTMPCLAFEFIPPDRTLNDPNQLVTVPPAKKPIEFDMSMTIANKVTEMENLDQRLASDDELRLEMAVATEKLLKDAGYAASAIEGLDDF